MGLKSKINVSLISVIVVASVTIIFFAYLKSRQELKASVDTGNLSLAHATASDIYVINARQFKMLESLANLSVVRDPEVDMYEKWKLVNSATGGSKEYIGMGFFNEKGQGYPTSGKWSDLHDREYLVESMKGRHAIMDPAYSAVNGHICTYYAVPVKAPNGSQIAEVTGIVDASNLCDTVAGITVGKSSHPFVISRVTGRYIAHEDVELVKQLTVVSDNTSKSFQPILNRIMDGYTATEVYYDENARQKFTVAYQPIEDTNWSVVLVAPYDDFYSGISELMRTLIIIGILGIVSAVVIGVIVVSVSIKPLSNVSVAVEDIASGDADLTKRLHASSKDEIGHLVHGFNNFTEKLRAIISELKGTKGDLNSYGENLATMVQENTNLVSQMLKGIKDVNLEIVGQHEKVGSTVGAVGDISGAVEELRKLLETQEQAVAQASSAVEEMIGNIGSVSASIEKMVGEFEILRGDVGSGISRQHEVSEQIQQIEQQSNMLNEANTVISSIAEQTNLLAMNAAIEAAHAGEAGKGFAVVADEIRKLSENSANQSKNIGTQLKSILSSISNVVMASDLSDQAFTAVSDKLQGTGNLIHEIKTAMDEQAEGSKQIGEAVSYMNDATGHVRTASENVDTARKAIIEDVQGLKVSSDTVKQLVEGMEVNVKHIEEDDESLLNIATSINGTIYRIGSQIDQFKV